MPSGFKHEYQCISEAIKQATRADVLIFAAPANWGNSTDIAYPGRLFISSRVIAMFSTTAANKPVNRFNPAPSKQISFNLAILGESVTIPGVDTVVEGTSVSTVLGAGLAGRILAFANQPDYREKISQVGSLKDVHDMSSIFKSMSVPDSGYDCIIPEQLLPQGNKSLDEKRDYICQKISMVLENRFRSH